MGWLKADLTQSGEESDPVQPPSVPGETGIPETTMGNEDYLDTGNDHTWEAIMNEGTTQLKEICCIEQEVAETLMRRFGDSEVAICWALEHLDDLNTAMATLKMEESESIVHKLLVEPSENVEVRNIALEGLLPSIPLPVRHLEVPSSRNGQA